MGRNREEKRKNGYVDYYVYLYSPAMSKLEEMRREADGWCVEHRIIPHYVLDSDGEKIKDLLYLEPIDKSYGLVIYTPEQLGGVDECLVKLFMISTRGVKTFKSMDGWDVPDSFKYLFRRYPELSGRRILDCRKKKAREGIFLNHDTPFGYKKNNEKAYHVGDMLQDKYEAFIVRYVYYRHEQGFGETAIANELTARGFTNRAGKEFNRSTVRKILKNQDIYMGYLTQEGVRVKGKYIPLLDENGKVDMSYIGGRFDVEKESRQAKKSRQRKKTPHFIKPCKRDENGDFRSI